MKKYIIIKEDIDAIRKFGDWCYLHGICFGYICGIEQTLSKIQEHISEYLSENIDQKKNQYTLFIFSNWCSLNNIQFDYMQKGDQIIDFVGKAIDKFLIDMKAGEDISENKKLKIYISGPMTGYESTYKDSFNNAEKYLRDIGYIPLNPVKVDVPNISYEDQMKLDLTLLEMADGIYMLKEWENSKGANRELGYALGKKLKVLYEK